MSSKLKVLLKIPGQLRRLGRTKQCTAWSWYYLSESPLWGVIGREERGIPSRSESPGCHSVPLLLYSATADHIRVDYFRGLSGKLSPS
jgi:hypothetical protein